MPPLPNLPPASPWLTVRQACARAQVSHPVIYRAIATGRLKAVRVDHRRQWRIHFLWLDAWLEFDATGGDVVNPDAPGPSLASLKSRR